MLGRTAPVFALAALSLAAVSLSGCKKEQAASPQGASPAGPAAANAAALPRPEPGLYRSTMTLVSLDAPGMPPAMATQMKGMFARRQGGNEFCLHPDEAQKGYEERVKKLAGRPNCAFDRYAAGGGSLDAQLTCSGEQGAKTVLGMKGQMTPTGSDVTMTMDQSAPHMPQGSPMAGGMKMTMRVKSERIGDCPA